jgi:hypothetical protein
VKVYIILSFKSGCFILQQEKQIDTYITINDLALPDGSAGGTEVIIRIPIIE